MAKILLVDDEISILQSVGMLLKTEGHDVSAMKDSVQAAETLKSTAFDLLVTDIRMPELDGMQLIKIAHSKNPPIPSIVISAYGSASTEQESHDIGCATYIQKPFRIEQVLEAVRNLLKIK